MGFGKDGKGMILYDEAASALSTLGADTVLAISGGYTSSLTEDFRIVKMDYWMSYETIADQDGQGPLLVGIASGDLSAAEIKECLESRVLNRSKRIETEMSMRPVWPLEIYTGERTRSSNDVNRKGSINLRWTFSDAAAWVFWVYNMSGDALITGDVINIFAKIFGVWVT